MVSLEAARKAARRAHESTYYEGLCSITEYAPTFDETTKITGQTEQVVVENQPCKLSFEKITAVQQTETAAAVTQGVKLFVAPEIEIKPGSKITVTQHGITTSYEVSGKPAVYPTHQEVMLEIFRGWA